MVNCKLSDYKIEVHDVGYFVFIDLTDINTNQQIRVETNKEDLKDIFDYLINYLENN
jgi:hypothetical protein